MRRQITPRSFLLISQMARVNCTSNAEVRSYENRFGEYEHVSTEYVRVPYYENSAWACHYRAEGSALAAVIDGTSAALCPLWEPQQRATFEFRYHVDGVRDDSRARPKRI